MNIIYYILILLLAQQKIFTQTTNATIATDTNITVVDTNTVVTDTNTTVVANITVIDTNTVADTNATVVANITVVDTNTVVTDTNVTVITEEDDFSVANIFRVLLASYPHIVKQVPNTENPYYPELAINVRGTNFYNVNGRFLPEEKRKKWKKYSSNAMYLYPEEIPDPSKRTKAEIAQMKKQSSKFYRKRKKPTYYGFNEALYGMSRLSDTNAQIMKAHFLGKQVLVHQLAYESLKQVEKEIYDLTNSKEYSTEVRKFLKEGTIVYSFFWRTIAGSKSRSLHSYGVAVDVLEENSIKAMYWLWRQNLKIDWIREPISVRWNPPNSVVKIFEKHGFVWGGKWNFYDTMHFEYKPEILLINGYDVTFSGQKAIESIKTNL